MRAHALAATFVILAWGCSPSAANSVGAAGTGSGGGAGAPGDGAAQPSGPIPDETRQLLVVVSADWPSVPATLQRHQRADGSSWEAVGAVIPVVLGKSGLGWGRGLTAPVANGPTKQEGDGRSPAGVFTLGTAFGYAPPDQATFLQVGYVQATADLECVDDIGSSHYNQLVHRSEVSNVDWSSSEKMSLAGDAYRWGLFVNHNVSPVVPGDGSCIFLHVWNGAGSSTVGCTASAQNELTTLLGWLDPAKQPLLVQLPQAEYDARRSEWSLP